MLRIGLPIALLILLLPPIEVGASEIQTVHVVTAGQTLWSIAMSHGVPLDTIVETNRLPSPDRLQIGDRLVIPSAGKAPDSANRRVPTPALAGPIRSIHTVQSGDTLWTIAQIHGTSVEAIATLNRLADPDRLQPGQQLQIDTPAFAPPDPGTRGRATITPPPRQPQLRPRLIWPSRGVITSRFGVRGRRHHHGIDIAAPVGTPISAALDGDVQFVGRRGGYGLLVILEHGSGLTTWYGHASRVLVTVGQHIRQGQSIAAVGTTGEVTGPNLHFELRRNNVPLDPIKFLQSR